MPKYKLYVGRYADIGSAREKIRRYIMSYYKCDPFDYEKLFIYFGKILTEYGVEGGAYDTYLEFNNEVDLLAFKLRFGI